MSRYSNIKQEEIIPWRTNEINVLLRKVKENATLEALVKIHRRSANSIKAKLNTVASDYYFTNQELFKQIQAITGISEKEFLVKRCQSEPKVETSETTAIETPKPGPTSEEESMDICTNLALKILNTIIYNTVIMKNKLSIPNTVH